MTSNTGKWDRWYNGLTIDTPQTYGDTITYEIGASFLNDCNIVQDWGCGKGGFGMVAIGDAYDFKVIGIDGSRTPFADFCCDLVLFQAVPPVDGIFMRHVLEHDYQWRTILENAIKSFTKRMVLVLFTPMQHETHEIAWNEDPGVPDIGFSYGELAEIFTAAGLKWERYTYRTNTQYKEETVFLLEKPE